MIKIHTDKRIGTVVYVVEGKKTEPKIIRDIFIKILGYQVYQVNNKRDVETLKKTNDKYSKVIIITINKPQVSTLLDNNINDFYNSIFNVLLENKIDISSVPIFYIFDRDRLSNSLSQMKQAMLMYDNSRDSKDFELVHGLLLVSYPSIESFYLNSNNSFEEFSTPKEIKKYVNMNYLKSLSSESLSKCVKCLIDALSLKLNLTISIDDLDNFSEKNISILEKEEKNFLTSFKYISISLLILSLLDLGIIEII